MWIKKEWLWPVRGGVVEFGQATTSFFLPPLQKHWSVILLSSNEFVYEASIYWVELVLSMDYLEWKRIRVKNISLIIWVLKCQTCQLFSLTFCLLPQDTLVILLPTSESFLQVWLKRIIIKINKHQLLCIHFYWIPFSIKVAYFVAFSTVAYR